MTTRTTHSDGGFSLPEVLIAMGIMLILLGGTFAAMTQAMRAMRARASDDDMNASLRSTMDLVVRDFLQMGQGLPDGRRIEVPNGNGAGRSSGRPTAAAAACPGVPLQFPAEPSSRRSPSVPVSGRR